MNKDNVNEYMPIIKAIQEGKTIQFYRDSRDYWEDLKEVTFIFKPDKYRVKPDPIRKEFYYVAENNPPFYTQVSTGYEKKLDAELFMKFEKNYTDRDLIIMHCVANGV